MFSKIAFSSISMLLIDAIYLRFISPHFNKMFVKIQGHPIQVNTIGFILSYISLVTGLYYFILREKKSPYEAFLLGLFVYSVYEAVNYATISKWNPVFVIIDSLWGGILFALITYLTNRFA